MNMYFVYYGTSFKECSTQWKITINWKSNNYFCWELFVEQYLEKRNLFVLIYGHLDTMNTEYR